MRYCLQEECMDLQEKIKSGILKKPTVVSSILPPRTPEKNCCEFYYKYVTSLLQLVVSEFHRVLSSEGLCSFIALRNSITENLNNNSTYVCVIKL